MKASLNKRASHLWSSLILFIAFASSCLVAPATANTVSKASDASTPVLVKFSRSYSSKERVDAMRAKLLLNDNNGHRQQKLGEDYREIKAFEHMPMVTLSVTKHELESLRQDPTLEVVENKLHRPLLAQSVNRVYPSKSTSPFHGANQWVVAVLDSGIDASHPMLSGKIVSQACYSNGGAQPSTSSLCPGGVSATTSSNSGQPCSLDGCAHGTQVAGVVASNGAAFDGVAKDANLISIQVYSQVNDESFCFPELSCLGAYTSDIIAGLERVYNLRNHFDIAAVTVSLGSDELYSGSCDNQPEKAIIDQLKTAGVAVVAAAGNSGNTSRMQSPACISSAIAVAATFDNSDTPWTGNNISDEIDFFAPGVNITSTSLNNGFETGTGTSLAAPHVAGAIAVLKHASPELGVNGTLSLLKRHGPTVSQHAVSRRRLSLTSALSELFTNIPNPNNSSASAFLPAVIFLLGDED